MLTSKERAFLRSLAQKIEPITQVGKLGVNDALIEGLDKAIEKRELIKLTALETSPESSREAADKISEAVGADVVQVIGRKFVLYRKSKENQKIFLKTKTKK